VADSSAAIAVRRQLLVRVGIHPVRYLRKAPDPPSPRPCCRPCSVSTARLDPRADNTCRIATFTISRDLARPGVLGGVCTKSRRARYSFTLPVSFRHHVLGGRHVRRSVPPPCPPLPGWRAYSAMIGCAPPRLRNVVNRQFRDDGVFFFFFLSRSTSHRLLCLVAFVFTHHVTHGERCSAESPRTSGLVRAFRAALARTIGPNSRPVSLLQATRPPLPTTKRLPLVVWSKYGRADSSRRAPCAVAVPHGSLARRT
jgi:hypothetical protein